VYEGDFKGDVRTGKGTFKWANGDVYERNFKDDVITVNSTYNGQMAICMKGIGRMTKELVKVYTNDQLAIFIKVFLTEQFVFIQKSSSSR